MVLEYIERSNNNLDPKQTNKKYLITVFCFSFQLGIGLSCISTVRRLANARSTWLTAGSIWAARSWSPRNRTLAGRFPSTSSGWSCPAIRKVSKGKPVMNFRLVCQLVKWNRSQKRNMLNKLAKIMTNLILRNKFWHFISFFSLEKNHNSLSAQLPAQLDPLAKKDQS